MKQDRSLVGKSRKVEINWEKETTLTQEEKEFLCEKPLQKRKAEGLAEVPIGAVIVRQGKLLAAGII